MIFRNFSAVNSVHAFRLTAIVVVTALTVLSWIQKVEADTLAIPNGSFESPEAPRVTPYAFTNIAEWQKSDQPIWYDPSQNNGALWTDLAGQFFNVPFPGQFIDNCDGAQGAFIFGVPEVALFQDYDSISESNTTHTFDAKFKTGARYDLTVGLIGGGFGMKPGVTLELSLYYRDASSNKVKVASTNVAHSAELFPTNTHFVDFQVHVPTVKATDSWAEQHIGIQLLSTTSFELAGGYWDVDNVRLTETLAQSLILSAASITNGQFSFTVLSEPGVAFEVQATANFAAGTTDWTGIGSFTNVTGVTVVTEDATNFTQRFYRARQL
jgi:hypothetical protein